MLVCMRSLVLAAVVSLAVVLGGCGEDTSNEDAAPADASSPTTSETGAPTPEEESGDGQRETPELLDFTGTTVAGETFDGASLAGRPTVLWFWAPWCPTCRGQIPQVERLAADHDGDVNVIGIGSLDSAEAIGDFAGDVPGVTHLEDVEGELWKRFEVTEQSSFVVLDADGTVTFEAGYGGSDELDAEVQGLLG